MDPYDYLRAIQNGNTSGFTFSKLSMSIRDNEIEEYFDELFELLGIEATFFVVEVICDLLLRKYDRERFLKVLSFVKGRDDQSQTLLITFGRGHPDKFVQKSILDAQLDVFNVHRHKLVDYDLTDPIPTLWKYKGRDLILERFNKYGGEFLSKRSLKRIKRILDSKESL